MCGWVRKWLMIILGLLLSAEHLNSLQFGTIDDICEGNSCRQNDLSEFFTDFELLPENSNSERQKRHTANQNSQLLYRFNILNETFLLNLTKFEILNTILAPTFFAQHLGVNYTFVTNYTNSFISFPDRNGGNDCIYYGEILYSYNNQPVLTSTNESLTILNLCSGLYGVLELPLGVYFVEPLLKKSPDQRSNQNYIVYRHKSLTFHNRSAAQNDLDEFHSNKEKQFGSKLTNAKNRHRFKRSISREHHVEVLVVADARLRRYHGSNLENYILTLLSIVASIYRHPSIEASIDIVLVRLIILDHEEAGPKITRDAHETLKYFCRWQETLNDKDDDNSLYHHDVAILLTRHDICRSPGKCDTLGLAELGTICDNLRSCAIIEDNGLSAAFTIAHELGHLFNIPHDDEKKCEAFMALEKQNYHIMAPTLEFNAHPWSWSQCSSKTLKLFLEDTQPKCLFDKPLQQKYFHHFVDNPNPGRLFNIDQQCQFVFGPSASLCPYMGTCKLLWCSVSPHHFSGCRTQHMPWADGTYCGHNKWCYHGECVGLSPDQLSAQKGGWGEWQEWKSCSRSCGSGVQKSERFCDNPRPSNGGRYCLGERIRVRSCNVKECPLDTPDFRELQCSEFNHDRRGIQGVPENVRWVPQYTGINSNDRCKLYCSVESRSDFYMMKSKVIDGTPCDQESDDICVDGQCKQAGCDGYLKSNAKRDHCGICGGDGSKCNKEYGKYNQQTTYGYNFVCTFRAGLNNIDIRQTSWNGRSDDDTYLALQDSSGQFILNGHFQVSVFHRQIRVQGAILEYSGSDSVVERINSSKPILEDLQLHVLSVGQLKPPNIAWEYLKLDDLQVVTRRIYFWTYSDWSQCNQICQGSMKRIPACALTGEPSSFVNERYCQGFRPPEIEEKACNENCSLTWISQYTSQCSSLCGPGQRQQESLCFRTFDSGEKQRLSEEYCSHLDKPPSVVRCFNDCEGRQWVYSNWSPCSATCGGGLQKKSKHCVDSHNSMLDERYCENIISEITEQKCGEIPCPFWHYDEWGRCSVSCGGGVQLRHAFCADKSGNEVDYRLCNASDKLDRRSCSEQLCSKWTFGPWSECSSSCGIGTAKRDARCVDTNGNVIDDAYCIVEQKIVSKQCDNVPCPHWLLSEWSPCSKTCLDGWSTRRTTCVDGYDREIDSAYCQASDLENRDPPPSHKPCNLGSCPFWRTHDWSPCSVSCGSGQQQRLIECVHKDEVVDSSFCRDTAQPEYQRICQLINCPIWTYGAWDSCSVSCGASGVQRRLVQCVYPDSNVVTESTACNVAKKPKNVKKCKKPCNEFIGHISEAYGYHVPSEGEKSSENTVILLGQHNNERQQSPVKWETGSWTECSVTCGNGTRRRYVACRDVYNRILTDIYCSFQKKPIDQEICSISPCHGIWLPDEWKPCSSTCGRNSKRSRTVKCVDIHNQSLILPEARCASTVKPSPESPCEIKDCPTDRIISKININLNFWRVGEWGQCSKNCGKGVQKRLVTCRVSPAAKGQISARINCPINKKPQNIRPCENYVKECYVWTPSAWSECNRTCGGGFQVRAVHCLRSPDNQIVDQNYCQNPIPANSQLCNIEPCRRKYVWKAGRWSACSVTCGRGKRSRSVQCVDFENIDLVQNDSFCGHLVKPDIVQRCRPSTVCPRWKFGPWSACSATCGQGTKIRPVTCYRNHADAANDQICSHAPKPAASMPCIESTLCPSYKWKPGLWSKCSSVCGNGQQKREILCLSDYGKKAPFGQCASQKKPESFRNCTSTDCPYVWVPSAWTTCSKSCGVGEQFRGFKCQIKPSSPIFTTNIAGKSSIRVPDHLCHGLEKVPARRSCTMGTCGTPYFWKTDVNWSQCSSSCGNGIQYRQVYCVNQSGNRVDRALCDAENKPKRKKRCFLRNCFASDCSEIREMKRQAVEDGVYEILVHGKRLEIYCCNMNTSTPQEYLPLRSFSGTNNARRNFAEFYSKRLLYPFTCPSNGNRNDSCICTSEGGSKSGITFYRKLRLDLKNMKINIMDSSFSETPSGSLIPYATAGDCYSAVHCPQGRFNIDLTGTGFKIARSSIWREEGHRTSMDIQFRNDGVIVEGRCGGYCGVCFPDKKSGLVIEVDTASL